MKSVLSTLNHSFIVFTLAIAGFWGNAYGQIDSVGVSIQFENATTPWDSLVPVDILQVDIEVHDIDFMGEVVSTLYDAVGDYPLALVKKTLAQFITEGKKSGDTVTIEFYEIDPQGSYRIETQVRNFQGANLPLVVTHHNNQ